MEKSEIQSEGKASYQIREKWGDAVGKGGMIGFLALPEALIRGQKKLELSSTEMMVLINILLHWWYADKNPFPKNHSIANRMGVDTRTVQRAVASLEKKKLIKRVVVRSYDSKNKTYSAQRVIELEGLVSRLNEIADDLRVFNSSVQGKVAVNDRN